LVALLGSWLIQAHVSAQTNVPSAAPIFWLDLSGLNRLDVTNAAAARQAWDTLQVATCIQGIVNRDSANVFIRFLPAEDDFWWNYLRDENGWLAKRPVILVRDVAVLLQRFAPQIKGVVLYNEQVGAAANVANTIAGVEDRVALRYDAAAGSLYSQLSQLPDFPKDVLKLYQADGSPLFTGKGMIPGTSIPSTGSAKNDAYRWAAVRYLDTGRCSRDYLAYYLDSFWLDHPTAAGPRDVLANSTVENHDFFISHRAFFFDLGVYGDAAPVDDPNQPLGTDRETLISLLRSMNHLAHGQILTIGGFLPWAWKYVGPTGTGPHDFKGSGGKHHPVHNEWELARLASAYNFVMDADALGFSGLANASFYQHFPLKEHYPQNPRPALADLRAHGLVLPDGSVKNAAYVAFYMGDYDSSAWLARSVPRWWTDPKHGKIACNWAFDPNLDRRVPQALDYVRTHQSTNDWFISGDCGAGYLNPGMLTAPRLDSAVPDGWPAWTQRNLEYFHRYDLTITGFIIEGFAPFMGSRGFDEYAKFSPDGLMIQTESKTIGLVGLHRGTLPYVRHRLDLDGSPAQAGATLAAQVGREQKAFAGGPQFLMARTILKSPTWHAETMAAAKAAPGGERIEFVDADTFFLLLKTQLGRISSPR
jgi:hypothetical protein